MERTNQNNTFVAVCIFLLFVGLSVGLFFLLIFLADAFYATDDDPIRHLGQVFASLQFIAILIPTLCLATSFVGWRYYRKRGRQSHQNAFLWSFIYSIAAGIFVFLMLWNLR